MVQRIKITDKMLEDAVKSSFSMMGVLRCLGIKQAGGSNSHYKRRIMLIGLDCSHFTGKLWNKGKKLPSKRSADNVLVLRYTGARQNSKLLVKSLIEIGRKHECAKHECAKCGLKPEWKGSPLTLDVDHVDENWLDDRAENLRFLCPNCHSQFSRGLIGDMA